ncbi:MAG: carboxymuconolactone decarboxylase family protein [Pseudomonadota bacterium]
MARIAYVDPASAQGRAKTLLDGAKQQLGMVPNLFKVMANEPAVLDTYFKMNGALDGGSFDKAAREAIALTVAGENECGYCASAHTAISKSLKVEPLEIDRRLAGHSENPKLEAALVFASRVVAAKGWVSDADIQAVRDAGHDDAAIVEIVANVVANIFTNYLNHLADTDIDFPKVDLASRKAA